MTGTQREAFEKWWQTNSIPVLLGGIEVRLFRGCPREAVEYIWQAGLAHSQQNKEPIKPDNVLQGYWDKAMAGYRFVITNRKDE